MKRKRRLAVAGLALLAVVGALLLALYLYLRSDRVRDETIARLEALYGGRVSLERVDIGTSGTSLYGLQFFEADAAPHDPPWITVRELDVDVTVLDLIGGEEAPRHLVLTGVAVVLRFDADGRLLTRPPRPRQGSGAFPNVRIRDSRLTIRQEGRPDMVVAGIDAQLSPEGERLVVRGGVADSYWGEWDLGGELDLTRGEGGIDLKTGRTLVTQAKLEALPLVPASVWRQVRAEGETPVGFTLRWSAGAVRYRVALAPEAARLRVAAIDLDAERVSGGVVVEDGLLQLRDLRGTTAGGEVDVSGNLDFSAAPSRYDLRVAVRRLDLRRLPASWGLPDPLAGALSGETTLRITSGADRVTIDGDGRGAIDEAMIAGVPARPIGLEVRPSDGDVPSSLTADVAMDDADLDKLTRTLAPDSAIRIAGRFSLGARLTVPLDTMRDRQTYHLDGSVRSDRVEIDGRPVTRIEAALGLERGDLAVTGLRAWLDGMPIAGGATLETSVPYRYHARLDLRHGDLASLHRLMPELRPDIDLQGRFALSAELRGTLRPFTLAAGGAGRVSPLRLDDVLIEQAGFRWESDGRSFHLRQIAASLYGGRLSGTVRLPLGSGEPGGVLLRFDDLNLAELGRDVPGLPFALEGRAAGTLEGTLSAAGAGRRPELSARIDLRAPRVRVQGVAGEELRATIRYQKSTVAYQCEGQTLGGRFVLQGRLPGRATPGAAAPEGTLSMEGIELVRLWPELGAGAALEGLGGTLDLEVAFRHEGPDGRPAGSGRFALGRLRWGDAELAGGLRGDLAINGEELRLRDLTGTVGEGLLRGQLRIDLRHGERGWFDVRVQNVEAARLLAPWPAWAARVQGPVELQLRGALGREWSGDGRLRVVRGRVLGVEVADLQAPLDFVFAPRFGSGQLNLREAGVQLAQGRATARARLDWGAVSRLEGQVRFFSVDLRALLRHAEELGRVGGGRVSGRVDFGANDFRSIDDLTASAEASFAQTRMLELPVLRPLLPYLLPGQGSSPVFQSGSLRAHLSRGVVRIQRLTLTGTLLQLLLEGTITLQGRLDLSVTASNGRSDAGPGGFRLPAGPASLAVLRQATGFLANRLVRLHVGGTVRSPAVRVEPLPLLTEDAARFFLDRP